MSDPIVSFEMHSKSHGPCFIEAVIGHYIDRSFDYEFPARLGEPVLGGFIKVPFQNRILDACITQIKEEPSIPEVKIKKVRDTHDAIPPLSQALFKLGQWMSEYYACPLGLVFKSFIPSAVFKSVRCRKELSCATGGNQEPFVLTPDQNHCVETVTSSINRSLHEVFLLWGVTGSGKTEVYFHCIRETLQQGRSALMLVPEIALTTQLIERVHQRFKESVAVFHSRLTDGERALNWLKVARGEIRFVLGARSAVFAPLKRLGLLIVDEEHERAYKQEEAPKYNARDMAVLRGRLENAVVILGSATPSMESYFNCQMKKYRLLKLPKRISKHEMPSVIAVDMQKERTRHKKLFIFSDKLVNLMDDRLKKKEQIILFLNRRGFSTCLVCPRCGMVLRCSQCSVSLTYHKEENNLLCHHCEHKTSVPSVCPECKLSGMQYLGFGTEKVEKNIRLLFPDARIARLDSDALKKKGALEKVWDDLKSGQVDILIGTQMIAKGLDVANVTLVGVLAADLALNIPDFRSGESTFQLITQVAGRAGRGDIKGEVVIQSDALSHPVLIHALNQDFSSFYEYEIRYRKELQYPPFVHFIRLEIAENDEQDASRLAKILFSGLKKQRDFKPARIFEPVPCPLKKIRTRYRWQILVSTGKVKPMLQLICAYLRREFASKNITIDVDPQSFL
ncbi:MAG: primosomal protein N' [Candidatus Aureabacteria bacterium]|nr:primosomal protein N' [Candidatus Auribacterota bacterium]